MRTPLAVEFRSSLRKIHASLLSIPESTTHLPWREGGWTRREILGHLLDSATNNRYRFAHAALHGGFQGPGYDQVECVRINHYAEWPWAALLGCWQLEHELLTATVDLIPADALQLPCRVGNGTLFTLQGLIQDYLRHHRHHLAMLLPSQP